MVHKHPIIRITRVVPPLFILIFVYLMTPTPTYATSLVITEQSSIQLKVTVDGNPVSVTQCPATTSDCWIFTPDLDPLIGALYWSEPSPEPGFNYVTTPTSTQFQVQSDFVPDVPPTNPLGNGTIVQIACPECTGGSLAIQFLDIADQPSSVPEPSVIVLLITGLLLPPLAWRMVARVRRCGIELKGRRG